MPAGVELTVALWHESSARAPREERQVTPAVGAETRVDFTVKK